MARTSSSELAKLIGLLGLTDDETLAIFEVDPLSLISGELGHRPELPILVTLTETAAEQVGRAGLHRWLRAGGPAGRPIDLLATGNFAGFEDALAVLGERGLVVASPKSPAVRPGAGAAPAGPRPPGRHGETAGL